MTTHQKASPHKVTKRFTRHAIAVAIGSGLLLTQPVWANDPTGRVFGRVESQTGQSVADAEVTLKHESKGIVRTVRADAEGRYEIKALPVGKYTITIRKDGYSVEQREQLEVNVGSNTVFNAALSDGGAETIVVTGGRLPPVDTTQSSSGIVIKPSDLDTLPISEDLNSIGLLAPGAVAANSQFGGLVSFSGASAAENGFFLNGLNVTELRKGMGYVEFPQEVVQETEVITGGVSAKYGRFIGGVTNAVSKSGSNEWQFGGKYYDRPDSLRAKSPSYFGANSLGEYDLIINNKEDVMDQRTITLYGGGALLQDKAFVYAALASGIVNSESADPGLGDTTLYSRDEDNSQVFINLDWFMAENHSLNMMYMKGTIDYRDKTFDYNYHSGKGAGYPATKSDDETTFYSLRYTGQLTDVFSISATAGKVEYSYNFTDGTLNERPIYDARSGTSVKFGDWVGESSDINGDSREILRVDFEWDLGDHLLAFGYDSEEMNSWRDFGYHGPDGSHNELYTYRRRATPSAPIQGDNGDFILPSGDHIRGRDFSVEGETLGTSKSVYIADRWQVADTVMLNVGVRNEVFSNETGAGEEYIKVDDQWAPRFSIIWDVFGDGKDKAFFNYGRYFQPVAQNTSIRMTALETNRYRYYTVAGTNPDGTLIPGDIIGQITYANGTVRPGVVYAAKNLDPMFEDEVSFGWEHEFSNNIIGGVRIIHRELKSSIEDSWVSHGVLAYCEDQQLDCSRYESEVAANSLLWNGGNARIINPGQDVTIIDYIDGDNTMDTLTIPAEYLGYPDAERSYDAIEFTAGGRVSDNWKVNASFTYSKSEGNTEGLLRSDNGQADPGWTRSFDSPGLVDNGYGLLPNDHTISLKWRALYTFNENWSAGMVYNGASGSPINAFGRHPTDQGACATHFENTSCLDADTNENFYVNGLASPRGSHGRTPWVQSFDLSVNYALDFSGHQLSASLDIFNAFNSQHVTRVDEYGQLGGGELNPQYGQPRAWQSPRQAALTLRFDF